ncbi:MAG TPA: hypothetical protein VFY60_01480 [Pyrinomonadaceae bacterium]|nr:hypothetical protein [Pyrinomonadaceae bacterium]
MAAAASRLGDVAEFSFYEKLNSVWHRRALNLFMFIVLAHWAEHLAQAFQIYVLGWTRPAAGGFLGLFFPWLVSSEILHYGYAIVMLVGLWILRKGFLGTSRKWWTIALVIQFWHHIEHAVLQWQAITQNFWFGSPVPVSFLQTVLPQSRVEIHLFYNAVVFIPMIIGMYYHMFPPKGEESAACSCSLRHETMQAMAA